MTIPAELNDRTEGWGRSGTIKGYPEYKDTGEWPHTPTHLETFDVEAPETRDGDWYRNGSLITSDS